MKTLKWNFYRRSHDVLLRANFVPTFSLGDWETFSSSSFFLCGKCIPSARNFYQTNTKYLSHQRALRFASLPLLSRTFLLLFQLQVAAKISLTAFDDAEAHNYLIEQGRMAVKGIHVDAMDTAVNGILSPH
jgi:hypothetical protein